MESSEWVLAHCVVVSGAVSHSHSNGGGGFVTAVSPQEAGRWDLCRSQSQSQCGGARIGIEGKGACRRKKSAFVLMRWDALEQLVATFYSKPLRLASTTTIATRLSQRPNSIHGHNRGKKVRSRRKQRGFSPANSLRVRIWSVLAMWPRGPGAVVACVYHDSFLFLSKWGRESAEPNGPAVVHFYSWFSWTTQRAPPLVRISTYYSEADGWRRNAPLSNLWHLRCGRTRRRGGLTRSS